MACIAKSFIATHQPQIEHTIEKIDVASISDAIQIVHRFPNKYRFKNNWIFDVEKRIYIFLYNNRKMILKQGKINKLKKEMNITEKVSQLMGKIKIGEKETIVVVPELHQINSTEGYLVSEYLGPDCNELFYQNTNLNITTSDLVLLFTELNRLSIFHKGLLPRNTIIKNNKIYLIDWESAILDRNIKNELLQYKTSLLVGWRYFSQITDKDIEISLLDWKNEQQKIKHLTTYEYTFKNMLGLENMDNYHIQRLCYENIINATSYTNYISLVKLDDILHAISGIIPIEIEVLIDFLLCEEMNQDSLYLYSNLSNIVKLARMKSFMEVNEKQTKSFICNQIKRLILSKLKNEYDGIGVRESIKKVIQNRYPEFNPLDGYLTIVEKFLLI
ncbi:MAG: hypothetical protein LBD75_08250 [Candidatus Peribacteria bacterium]|jgi:hypothetical protein|nr:hypothetical protein [Candidatus Peribacteria bacterium]